MSNVNKSTEIKIITRLLSKNAFDNYTLNKMHVTNNNRCDQLNVFDKTY